MDYGYAPVCWLITTQYRITAKVSKKLLPHI